jgi:uncharacterized protein YigA (DUF484 family)
MNSLSEQQVVAYLEQNTDFLINNPDLLDQLDVISQQNGTVSLAIHQQQILRKKNQDLKQNLASLIQTAKINESIFKTFSACQRDLMLISDFDELAEQLNTSINKALNVKESRLLRFDSSLKNIVSHRLCDSKSYLGRTTQDEVELLFKQSCQSIAIYLIGEIENPLGLLAFSSDDPLHFTPSHDNIFIDEFVHALKIKLIELN